jgi:drug/metabolite transporter (DMT)-like permease
MMALTVKLLGARLDSFQIAFFRAFVGLVALLPFVARGGGGVMVRTRRPVMHLARGVLGAGAMFCGYYALTHLPLADAVAISYARPLFLIVLAVLFLNETVRLRRWSATAVGFLGVLVMMRPGGGVELASLLALAGALMIAVVNVLVKKLAATERPVTILFHFGVISTIATLVPALVVWRGPTPVELLLLVLVGVLGMSAQACMIRGLRLGEATAVMPFDYVRLLIAGVVGFLVFAEVPDRWTLIGAAVIVAAPLYIALREARLGKAERSALDGGEAIPPRAE